ncbi:uncharacterized protein LOC143909915 isoform X1 [Arctopsyche grandis]|uniref:uncharacterized protein LOC143909915 isoform X1 n=1 Tax=Arctopsyche grandis TaxID=121162 RepID=UPI00406D9240
MNSSVKLSLDKICRICLKESSKMKGLFITEEGLSPRFYEMIMSCTKVVITENDGLPAQLCESCATQLTKLYSFKSQCESADISLRQFLLDPLSDVDSNIAHKMDDENKNASLYVNYGDDSIVSSDFNFATEKLGRSSACDVLKLKLKDKDLKIQCINSIKKKNRRISTSLVFGCRKCDLHFLSWNELDKHNSKHTESHINDKLQCRYCSITFLHQRHINPHIRQMHNELERFQCGYCGSRWCDIRTLRFHMARHSPGDVQVSLNKLENMITDDGNQNFTNELDQEKQKLHTKENIEKKIDEKSNDLFCYSCRQLFIDVESLQSHLIDKHFMKVKESPNSTAIEKNSPAYLDIEMQQNQDEIIDMVQDEELSNIQQFINNDSIETNPIKDLIDKVKINEIKKLKHKCSICGKCFRKLNDLQRHEATHDPDKPYYCQFGRCRWTFATEHELIVHTNVNHSSGTHECRFCHKTFKHSRNLRQHMIQHKLTKRFQCKHCHKGFNLLHHLQNHERTHTGDLPFLCQKCGRAFVTKDRLNVHIRRHLDIRPYSCKNCEKKFITVTELKVHFKIHSEDRLMCSVCGKTFNAPYNLNKHMHAQHRQIDAKDVGSSQDHFISACNICGFLAETLQQLDQHMKSHTCQYSCPHCEKSFPLTSSLETHIKTHSSGDRSHLCTICNCGFNRAEHLRVHIIRRHNTAAKSNKCSRCPRSFPFARDLTVHLRTHDKNRPYVCSECGRGFTTSGGMRVHSRIHSGERPYICNVCRRGYHSSGALVGHMRTHSSNVITSTKNSPTLQVKNIQNEISRQNSTSVSPVVDKESDSLSPVVTVVKLPAGIHSLNMNELEDFQQSQQSENSMRINSLQAEDTSIDLNQLVDSHNISKDEEVIYDNTK